METQYVGSFGHCVCQPDKHAMFYANPDLLVLWAVNALGLAWVVAQCLGGG